ncbi:VOC family protein [Actinocorallia sp. B10E7]|uniref:VOC family protein n=1 Tax=Actinocorallia sp. B10E7 TaxID=3153558 RepID=UPI00325C4AAC
MSEADFDRVDANPPEGTPSWLELTVPDPDRAREFYGEMFGWTFEEDLCLLNGLPVAAIRTPSEEVPGPEWTVFFAVDDCDQAAKRVNAAWGRVLRPPYEDGDRGRAALAADPTGARFGLWQGRELPGTRLVNGYGTFIFNELPATDGERSLAFYQEIFDYLPSGSSSSSDLVRLDGHTVASIIPHEVIEEDDEPTENDRNHLVKSDGSLHLPGHGSWLTYFAVDDAHKAVERLQEAGGWAYSQSPMECPWGSIATVKDPLGTPFRLIEPWDVI